MLGLPVPAQCFLSPSLFPSAFHFVLVVLYVSLIPSLQIRFFETSRFYNDINKEHLSLSYHPKFVNLSFLGDFNESLHNNVFGSNNRESKDFSGQKI